MDHEYLILKLGELYVLNDGALRFVGRLIEVLDGPNDTSILRMEVVWSPVPSILTGTHVPCLPRWVIRLAVAEDLPDH